MDWREPVDGVYNICIIWSLLDKVLMICSANFNRMGFGSNLLILIKNWFWLRTGLVASKQQWKLVHLYLDGWTWQGSVLGPQLFGVLIYAFHLDNQMECNISKFAGNIKAGGRVMWAVRRMGETQMWFKQVEWLGKSMIGGQMKDYSLLFKTRQIIRMVID